MARKWIKNPDGQLMTSPLAGFELARLADMFALLAIDYAVPPPEPQRPVEVRTLQLLLTPPQCREIAEALLSLAAKIEAATPPGPVH